MWIYRLQRQWIYIRNEELPRCHFSQSPPVTLNHARTLWISLPICHIAYRYGQVAARTEKRKLYSNNLGQNCWHTPILPHFNVALKRWLTTTTTTTLLEKSGFRQHQHWLSKNRITTTPILAWKKVAYDNNNNHIGFKKAAYDNTNIGFKKRLTTTLTLVWKKRLTTTPPLAWKSGLWQHQHWQVEGERWQLMLSKIEICLQSTQMVVDHWYILIFI